MDNLIENAIKYSANHVQIDISISDEVDRLKISIKDNGLGIEPGDLPYIFQKFYRSESRAVQRTTGFGLGLTYIQTMVDAHGGEIKVNSIVGKGSEFIVYFP